MEINHGDIKDSNLSKAGVDRINWAAKEMPVLEQIRARFKTERPLDGLRIAACLHVTSETANLAIALKEGGASVNLCASNPLSTQDEVAAALVHEYQIPTFAIKGEDDETYYSHIRSVLKNQPTITMDDGADLVAMIHQERRELIQGIIGGTEETTTGVIRLRAMSTAGKLEYPIVAVNEADTKHLFDNRYGTGQSTLDGITRATNLLWAGKKVVVMGYGWCGRGVASRARGLGANVIVTEIDPTKALEALMDGFTVLHSDDAARIGEVFITVTGGLKTIGKRTMELMQDGAIMANSGHFNVEIDIPALEQMATNVREVRPMVKEYLIGNGKKLNLLGDGRLINLSAAEGHPSSVMDMSFANQALSVEYLLKQSTYLEPKVYSVPDEMDREVGRLKLLAMGVKIDVLSEEQVKYINSWEEGT